MKTDEISHEEIRQLMLQEYEESIQEVALRVAGEMFPELPVAVVVERLTPKIRKAIFDSMKPEQRLFLEPTGPVC